MVCHAHEAQWMKYNSLIVGRLSISLKGSQILCCADFPKNMLAKNMPIGGSKEGGQANRFFSAGILCIEQYMVHKKTVYGLLSFDRSLSSMKVGDG